MKEEEFKKIVFALLIAFLVIIIIMITVHTLLANPKTDHSYEMVYTALKHYGFDIDDEKKDSELLAESVCSGWIIQVYAKKYKRIRKGGYHVVVDYYYFPNGSKVSKNTYKEDFNEFFDYLTDGIDYYIANNSFSENITKDELWKKLPIIKR